MPNDLLTLPPDARLASTSRRRLVAGSAALAALGALPAWSQAGRARTAPAGAAPVPAAWPTRPLRILVGFPAGSTPDLAARAVADPLAKLLGQPVVVENRPGACGNIAADQLAKARDDHTLGVLINGNLTIAKLLNPALPFDPAVDFTPITLVGSAPLVLVVAGNADGTTPAAWLAWAKGLGEAGNYGTPGNGTVGHLGMELLKSRTGIAAQHVPFNGNPQVVNALLGGQLQLALLPPALAMPHVRSGKLRAVGITSATRSVLVPELGTLREADGRGIDLEIWTAIAAPATLPKPIAAQLNAALLEVIRSPEVRQRLFNAGWQAQAGAPEALRNRMRSDTDQLGAIIRSRGIRSDS